jgi:GNAT superfamily N-acetyltransferase
LPEAETDLVLTIRYAQPSDAGHIAATLRSAFADLEAFYTPAGFAATTPSAGQIAGRFHDGPVWVAESQGLVVGTVSVVRRGDDLYVRSMAVHPRMRGKHIASRLLEAIEAFAIPARHRRLVLTTTPFLKAAIALYERAGFQRTGGQSDLYGTPLLEMAKALATD